MKNSALLKVWYLIYNPVSGGGTKATRLQHILDLLEEYDLPYKYIKTTYPHQEKQLVQKAIKEGFVKFICVGGDGTLHHMVNGIMSQNLVSSNLVKLAVIPTGTGNDWVKHYNIPHSPEKAISLLIKNRVIYQDIGKISLTGKIDPVYFNNAAGIGFDAYVVKHLKHYRKWGKAAYLTAALKGFGSYSPGKASFTWNNSSENSSFFMISIGICKYSGGGMQLTDFKNHQPGLFDISFFKSVSFLRIIYNIFYLYKGRITELNEVQCSQSDTFRIDHNKTSLIQADGELIGPGEAEFSIIPKAIQFIIT